MLRSLVERYLLLVSLDLVVGGLVFAYAQFPADHICDKHAHGLPCPSRGPYWPCEEYGNIIASVVVLSQFHIYYSLKRGNEDPLCKNGKAESDRSIYGLFHLYALFKKLSGLLLGHLEGHQFPVAEFCCEPPYVLCNAFDWISLLDKKLLNPHRKVYRPGYLHLSGRVEVHRPRFSRYLICKGYAVLHLVKVSSDSLRICAHSSSFSCFSSVPTLTCFTVLKLIYEVFTVYKLDVEINIHMRQGLVEK